MILNWKPFAFVLLQSPWQCPLHAQRAGGGGEPRRAAETADRRIELRSGPSVFGRQPTQPTHACSRSIPDTPLPKPQMVEDEACLPWALSQIRGATVSVVRLEVPDKARSEYEKACGDFQKKKMADAEQHVRSAIEKYSNYVAAWVMLGQVLAAQQQADKAHEACSHANATDPTYLPPYLCLAELDARSGNWDEILNVTKMALGLNPVGDVYAYFYRSMAFFNLNQAARGREKRPASRGHGHAITTRRPCIICWRRFTRPRATWLRPWLRSSNS